MSFTVELEEEYRVLIERMGSMGADLAPSLNKELSDANLVKAALLFMYMCGIDSNPVLNVSEILGAAITLATSEEGREYVRSMILLDL